MRLNQWAEVHWGRSCKSASHNKGLVRDKGKRGQRRVVACVCTRIGAGRAEDEGYIVCSHTHTHQHGYGHETGYSVSSKRTGGGGGGDKHPTRSGHSCCWKRSGSIPRTPQPERNSHLHEIPLHKAVHFNISAIFSFKYMYLPTYHQLVPV